MSGFIWLFYEWKQFFNITEYFFLCVVYEFLIWTGSEMREISVVKSKMNWNSWLECCRFLRMAHLNFFYCNNTVVNFAFIIVSSYRLSQHFAWPNLLNYLHFIKVLTAFWRCSRQSLPNMRFFRFKNFRVQGTCFSINSNSPQNQLFTRK